MNMADEIPKKKRVRVSMTKGQLAEGLGRELLELSNTWLRDGKLEVRELEELKAWLANAPSDSIPAIRFLREEVERYIADGQVHDWELSRLQAALIRVLPQKERGEAKNARSDAARIEWVKRAPERQEAQRASAEHWREVHERYASVWAHEPATEAQLDFIRDLGGDLSPSASKLEASETINRLLGREITPTSLTKNSGCLPLLVIGLAAAAGVAYFV
jgi:hypothetical protein